MRKEEPPGDISGDFYGCAATRDNKECNFFHRVDQKITMERKKRWKEREEKWKRHKLERFPEGPIGEGSFYCFDCQVIFEREDSSHGGHEFRLPTASERRLPASTLLRPLSNSKKEAQFHFTGRTLEVIIDAVAIKGGGATHALCIGAPTVGEKIASSRAKIKRLMLDIDDRLGQFYEESRDWCWYNMFNHHFFGGDVGKAKYLQFLKEAGTGLVVITDPPFGGKVELISHTLDMIAKEWRNENGFTRDNYLKTIWIFPYFMEAKITSVDRSLRMSDYQVNYVNHESFREGGRKQGSPVRMFTNIPLERICLPKNEGYKFCDSCAVWVSRDNLHCNMCGFCTGKNGGNYKHCTRCKRCVKSSWEHCPKCERCSLPKHPCNQFQRMKRKNRGEENDTTGCHTSKNKKGKRK